MNENVVIIGASHAAAEAVTALRKYGWEGGIALVGDEPTLPYHRPPLSKGYFNGEVSAEKLLIRGESVYQRADVDLHLGKRATSIDRVARTITLAGGELLHYTKLILATGATARRLPIEGADASIIFTLRHLADVDQIKSALPPSGHLLIVGAGYIGLEAAASAIKSGHRVTVLEAAERVLSRVTSPIISEFYQRIHQQKGVDIRLNSSLVKFVPQDKGCIAVMGDGEQIAFDCALVGIGVEPNIELAESAGLPCDNGIVVDEYTQTVDRDIYAVGDCCNHPNQFYQRNLRLESVPNAVDQAKTAALSICGKSQPYNEVPWFWSDQYDIKLQTVGLLNGFDEQVVRGQPESSKFSVFYLQHGRLIAMDAINSPADFMVSRRLIPMDVKPDKKQLEDISFSLKNLL